MFNTSIIFIFVYLRFLAFMAEPSPMGVGAGVRAGLGARLGVAPSTMVLAFLGGRLWALGITAMAFFTVAPSGFLALGGRPWSCPIRWIMTPVTWAVAPACLDVVPWAGACARASMVHQWCWCESSCS